MHFWLSLLRPKAGFFAGLILLAIFGCTKTGKRKGIVSVAATSQQNRPQAASLDVGSTTKDTAGACRARPRKDDSEETDDDDSSDDDSDEEASELRLAGDQDSGNARDPSVNVGGNSVRAAEDAEAIVSKQCKNCHGGSGSTANSNSQGGNRGGLSGRFGRNNTNNIVRSNIKFGGRDDLEVRANDIIEEFENPGRQHSSITNPDAVVKAFEDLKKAKERRLEKQANNCI
jgi:hypothetical protein